jgi:hypothetical protein
MTGLAVLLLQLVTASIPASAQSELPLKKEAVLEIKNFSEEKTLPELNALLRDHGNTEIDGYCLGQDLVVFHYKPGAFSSKQELASFLEDKGFIVYVKENMTSSEVIHECKSPFIKQTKEH